MPFHANSGGAQRAPLQRIRESSGLAVAWRSSAGGRYRLRQLGMRAGREGLSRPPHPDYQAQFWLLLKFKNAGKAG